MEEEKTTGRLSETIKIGGYLVAGGALLGFSIGVYFIFNRALFSVFIRIGQFESLSYFLGVFIPSFVILIVIGYLFVIAQGLKRVGLSIVVPLCTLAILCMVFSALSIFYLISFFGGALALMALIKAYARPGFKTLSEREAFFLMETGALFVASFSLLSFSMWLISSFFPSYAMGFYVGYSPFALLMAGVMSILMFFAIPLLGSRGTNAGACGALGLVMIILSYLFVVQNQYVFSNATAYISVFMLILGYALAVAGDLTYVRLFFSESPEPIITVTSSLLFQGTYCPYCGKPRVTASQSLCPHCGRSLMWTPYAPFCTACGRLVPTNAQTCPHCLENIGNKLMYFDLKATEEQAIASKVIKESMKEKSRTTKVLLSLPRVLRPVWRALARVFSFFSVLFNTLSLERLSLTLKEFVFVIILTYLFGFLSFIGYVKVVPSTLGEEAAVVMNYGFPLEWLQVTTLPFVSIHTVDVGILWISLILDIILYFLAALTLMYCIARLRH